MTNLQKSIFTLLLLVVFFGMGSIFAGGNDGEELTVEIVYPAGHGLPLGKGSDGSPFHLGENKLIGAKWRKIPKEPATAPEHSPPAPPR